MVLLATLYAPAGAGTAALVDTTSLTATYNAYLFLFEQCLPSAPSPLLADVSIDGGATWIQAGYVSHAWEISGSGTVMAGSTSAILVAYSVAAFGVNNNGFYGEAKLGGLSNQNTSWWGSGVGTPLGGGSGCVSQFFSSTRPNAIRFRFVGSTCYFGRVRIYGIPS